MDRIEEEKRVVAKMVEIYCRHKEHNKCLCKDCNELLEYSFRCLSHCRQGNAKPPCRESTIHCYSPEMREKMRQVMRYSGPRMLLFAPTDALQHLLRELHKKE